VNVFAFHLKTVPDLDAGRKFWNLGDLGDEEVGAVMHSKRRQETDGASDSIRHHFQKIVSISAVHRVGEKIQIWSLGAEKWGYAEGLEYGLLRELFSRIALHSPELVSWNGTAFDLPVLRYRSLAHHLASERYWNIEGQHLTVKDDFFLDNRTCRHMDLMNALAGSDNIPHSPLSEVASLLGFPNTSDMTSREVFEAYISDNMGEIRNKTDADVLKIWFIYLRFQHVNRHREELNMEIERTRDCLASGKQPHFSELLTLWNTMALF
jgi:hypothetical protein